jgi:hypothetical protein
MGVKRSWVSIKSYGLIQISNTLSFVFIAQINYKEQIYGNDNTWCQQWDNNDTCIFNRDAYSDLRVRLPADVADMSLQVLGVRVLGDVLPQTLQTANGQCIECS